MGKKIFYGWWVVFSCFFIGAYTACVVYYGFTAFFEPLVKEFGWSHAQVSLASSLRGLEMGIFSPFIGFLVDRFGSRKLVVSGVILVGLGLLLLGQTHSLVTFYIAFLLLSLGAGATAALVFMTVVANWFRKKIGLALGIMTSGFGASGLMVPIVVHLIDLYGWRTALVFLALGMWTMGLPLAFLIRSRPEQYGYFPDGDAPDGPPQEGKAREAGVEIGFRKALKERSLLHIISAEFLRNLVVTTVVVHIMPYLGNTGMSRANAGMMAAGIPLCSIIGRFGFGWLGDHLEKRLVFTLTFAALTLGMVAFCLVHWNWILLFAFLLLFAPGQGGNVVLRGSIIREYFGRDAFGKIIGMVQGAGAIGGIIGPTLGGWTFDVMRSYDLIWFVLTGLSVLCVLIASRIKPLGADEAELEPAARA